MSTDWKNLPWRGEDPCTQVQDFFERDDIKKEDLSMVLNALSRQGYQDIEHELAEEPDVHKDEVYKVSAWRLVCLCGQPGVSVGEHVDLNEQKPKSARKKRKKPDGEDQ